MALPLRFQIRNTKKTCEPQQLGVLQGKVPKKDNVEKPNAINNYHFGDGLYHFVVTGMVYYWVYHITAQKKALGGAVSLASG